MNKKIGIIGLVILAVVAVIVTVSSISLKDTDKKGSDLEKDLSYGETVGDREDEAGEEKESQSEDSKKPGDSSEGQGKNSGSTGGLPEKQSGGSGTKEDNRNDKDTGVELPFVPFD